MHACMAPSLAACTQNGSLLQAAPTQQLITLMTISCLMEECLLTVQQLPVYSGCSLHWHGPRRGHAACTARSRGMHIRGACPLRARGYGTFSNESMMGIPAARARHSPSRLQKQLLCHLRRQLLPAAEAHAAIWWLRLQAVARAVWLNILSYAAIANMTPGLSLICFRTTCSGSQCQGVYAHLCAYYEDNQR